jgi:alcohol dehydrogenase
MLAAVVPAKSERWPLQEGPVPKPLPTQVLVKVRASGSSDTDVEQTRGELPGHVPRILGHEVAGIVVAVGDAVTTRRVGDRVGVPYLQAGCGRCEWCLRRRPLMCPNDQAISAPWNGGHAEYMLAVAKSFQ